MWNRVAIRQPLEEALRTTESDSPDRQRESCVRDEEWSEAQGDPLSSLLFNTVLQVALKDNLARWQKKGMGICLGDSESDCLTNLRFAEDVLLFSTSLEQLQ